MTSWAQFIAGRSRQVHLDIRIEGMGAPLDTGELTAADDDARYRFCVSQPLYAAGQETTLWRDLLCRPWPDLMSEQVDLFGDVQTRGRLTLTLLDHQDFLTAILGSTEAQPVTLLDGAIDDTQTTIDVFSAANIPDDDLIFLEGECLLVTNIASLTLTVTRGYAGTDARPHLDRCKVHLRSPYIFGRRMELRLAPYDADGTDDERLIGEFVLDACAWSTDLNAWILGGTSQQKYLDRTLPRTARTARVVSFDETTGIMFLTDLDPEPDLLNWRHWYGSQLDPTAPPTTLFLQVDDQEIIGVQAAYRTILFVSRRQVLGTKRTEIKPGSSLRQVMVGDRDVPGSSLRFAPGPSPEDDLTAAGWIQDDGWVTWILALMTSPADDSFVPGANYDPLYDNYSVLPEGYGLGIPARLIHWPSFLEVKARTNEFRMPFFVLGPQTRTSAAKIIREQFLQPMGAYLAIENGQIRLILPRLPLLQQSVTAIGADDILIRKLDEFTEEPRLEVLTNTALLASGVRYLIGPTGRELTFRNEDFDETVGQRNYYPTDADPPTVPVASGDPDKRTIYGARAQAKLFRTYRPQIEMQADLDFGTSWNLAAGETGEMTLPELPERSAGTRGWTNVLVECLQREFQIADEDCLFGRNRLITYGPNLRIGRIAPAAYVNATATVFAVVDPNRYSPTNGEIVGVPVSDIEGFAIGDVVRLMSPDGTDASPGNLETIVDIDVPTNTFELSGDFSGDLATDTILVYATYDDAISQQTGRFAFEADRANLTVGSGTTAPYVFGEP